MASFTETCKQNPITVGLIFGLAIGVILFIWLWVPGLCPKKPAAAALTTEPTSLARKSNTRNPGAPMGGSTGNTNEGQSSRVAMERDYKDYVETMSGPGISQLHQFQIEHLIDTMTADRSQFLQKVRGADAGLPAYDPAKGQIATPLNTSNIKNVKGGGI